MKMLIQEMIASKSWLSFYYSIRNSRLDKARLVSKLMVKNGTEKTIILVCQTLVLSYLFEFRFSNFNYLPDFFVDVAGKSLYN